MGGFKVGVDVSQWRGEIGGEGGKTIRVDGLHIYMCLFTGRYEYPHEVDFFSAFLLFYFFLL